jgi:hypothetical protein
VFLELTPWGLLAANKGAPFSPEGVDSVCLAFTSPKPAEGAQIIGSKGLGFRALLNWTQSPLILSGDLAIVFSNSVAKQKQTDLQSLDERLRATIEQQQTLHGDLVVPLLAFPGFDQSNNLTHLLDNDAQKRVYSRCRELRNEGYDTVLGMPFFDDAKRPAACKQQLMQLRPEILLFAPNLAEIRIVIEGERAISWRLETDGQTSTICCGNDETRDRKWTVYKKAGLVPPQCLPDDQKRSASYEIALAIPMGGKKEVGQLFCYFPTELRFPYPIVCHATLNLQANRQQLQNTPANKFILYCLAGFMAETAEKLAAGPNDLDGLSLIAGEPAERDVLEKFGFREFLLEVSKTRAIVPTLGAGVITAAKARVMPFWDTSWLPARAFGNVARLGRDNWLRTVVKELGAQDFSILDWQNSISVLSFESIGARASFIANAIKADVPKGILAGLLLDSDGRSVPSDCRVFLPPVDQQDVLSIPGHYEIRFLNPELRTALSELLAPSDQEDLATRLAPLGVKRYSLDNILSSVIAQANKQAASQLDKAQSIRQDLVRVLWNLFPKHLPKGDRPRFPKDARVLVRTRGGADVGARELYLSAGYGPRGEILNDLYSCYDLNKLVASPKELALDGSTELLAEFLVWLGVAELPRELRKDVSRACSHY